MPIISVRQQHRAAAHRHTAGTDEQQEKNKTKQNKKIQKFFPAHIPYTTHIINFLLIINNI
jgi:hypothetical protein